MTNIWKLQDQEDWFPFFWTQCVEHIKQASVSALLQANCHRRNASSTERSIDPVSEIITNYASENLTIDDNDDADSGFFPCVGKYFEMLYI